MKLGCPAAVLWTHIMKGFIGNNNQHFEVDPEAKWQPVNLTLLQNATTGGKGKQVPKQSAVM